VGVIPVDLDAALRAALPPQAFVGGADLATRPAGWSRPDRIAASLLVRPASTGEVATVLMHCNRFRQPVVAQGGLTGLVHGADTAPGDLVLSLERMRTIESIDPVQRVAVVQAGVTLQALQEAVDAHGLAYPLDLGARGTATLGGTASTNAGGNRVLRWGMTRDMVLGLEVVLADGTVLPAMNRLIKNNAGYDLKHLFVGAEGTLGVITRLVLRLREKPGRQDVALVAVPGFEQLVGLLKHFDRALGGTLSAFEAMWPSFYRLVTTPPARSAPPLPHGHAYYALVESSGAGSDADAHRFALACESALAQGLVADAAIAQSQADAAAIWALRDDVVQCMRWGMPFAFDVSLPLDRMQAYVATVCDGFERRWPGCRQWVFGHLGDGNLHVVLSLDDPAPDARADAERIVYPPLRAAGGSVSAEHGIGIEKRAWLEVSRSDAEIDLMRRLKSMLDPHGILNPGKVV
jgi:FAD/FMN-containing dehydrogenase